MCLFVESLALDDGIFRRLEYHNHRLRQTQLHFYGECLIPPLEQVLFLPATYNGGLWKCRVIYDREIRKVECAPYVARDIRVLHLVNSETIDYTYKLYDKSAFSELVHIAQHQAAMSGKEYTVHSDILIVKNGLLTDCSYANLILVDPDGSWYTPKSPLLKGTMRSFLLETGRIKEKTLTVEDLRKSIGVMPVNAMLLPDPARMIRKFIF